MSEESTSTTSAGGAISLGRLLTLLVPVLAVAVAVRYTLPSYEKAAQQQMEQDVLAKLLTQTVSVPEAKIEFSDEDGDLVADSPADDACVTPEKLVFSFVGPEEETDESTTFAELVAALGEATGLEAEYRHYPSIDEQLAAMASGELHVVGLNTGTIPNAVRYAGFQPVSTFAREDGEFGYTMKLLAPSGGASDVEQLAGKRVSFTQPDSNSGFKAALIYLMDEAGLQPERDYNWGFSYAHETSIEQVAAGDCDAAPVASDILARLVADGEVEESAFTVLYESERFPPVTLGYAHNLAPALREAIRTTLIDFDWAGTGMEAKYGSSGATQFAAVSFKDDWANIRRIDEVIADARAGK